MALFRQEDMNSAVGVPWASTVEYVATAAIADKDIIILDSATGLLPKASPASSAAVGTAQGVLMVAVGAVSAGAKGKAAPWRVISGVDTSAGAAGAPIYLSTGGDWSLSMGVVPQIVGSVLTAASSGVIILRPTNLSKAVINTEVVSHEFFDDFIYDQVDWTKTADSTGTAACGDAQYGILTVTNAATTDDDATQTQFDNETFKLTVGKRLWFEARIKCAAGDATNLDFFVGLAEAEDLTGVADNMPANGIGFHKDDGDTNIDLSSSDGGTNLQSAAVDTLVDATWVKLGFVFDGGATGSATITPYIDGVAGTAISSVTYATMAEMSPIVMVRNGDATTTQSIQVDYIKVVAER